MLLQGCVRKLQLVNKLLTVTERKIFNLVRTELEIFHPLTFNRSLLRVSERNPETEMPYSKRWKRNRRYSINRGDEDGRYIVNISS